jgi:hypothetical protein
VGQAKRRVPRIAAVGGTDLLPADASRESIGAYLALQRELRGITLEELSRATRIPVRSLQRLEDGAFDHAPDGFARGFVRTVALALGLPADETVARMLPEVDADAYGSSRRRVRRVAVALAAGVVVVALGAGTWAAVFGREAPSALEGGSVVHPMIRRDPVRELARQQGLLGPPQPGATRAAP